MGDPKVHSLYVLRGGKVHGPFTSEQILSLRQKGKLRQSDLFSTSKTGPWNPTTDVPSYSPMDEHEIISATVVSRSISETPSVQTPPVVTPPRLPITAALSTQRPVRSLTAIKIVFPTIIALLLISVSSYFLLPRTSSQVTSSAVNQKGSEVEINPPGGVNEDRGDALPSNDEQKVLENPDTPAAPENGSAMYSLAIAARHGEGMAQSDELCFFWMKQAAEAGWPAAMADLALCYADGIGTTKDLASFMYWLERSAKAGDARGMYFYGFAIQQGFIGGTTEDANAWIARSLEAGFRPVETSPRKQLSETEVLDRHRERFAELTVAAAIEGIFQGFASQSPFELRSASSEDQTVCNASGTLFPCSCSGFEPGGQSLDPNDSTAWPSLVCRNCNHKKECHSR